MLSRPVRCLLSLLVIACSGCVFPWTAYHLERPARSARVILVRGLAGYWPGAEPLAHRLRKQGLDASVVFGSEGKGISASVMAACPEAVAIAMPPTVDSLNVGSAAAVFLYEASRQRGKG